jgi:hypothetical protein
MHSEELAEQFEQASEADFTPTKDWTDPPCEVIDGWLEELDDLGVRFRVWIG